ncbi:MAG: hypothetical protein M3Z49_14560, partial [Bifidobacteriales bacterium]|nr:hypothetical protein [Bifidobacteriales bacterium]
VLLKLLFRRMTDTRKTATQCRLLPWAWGMASGSEAVWKMMTVLPILICLTNHWQVTILPRGTVLPGVLTERPAVVAVTHVLAALAEVLRLQSHEQMRMTQMFAGRLP